MRDSKDSIYNFDLFHSFICIRTICIMESTSKWKATALLTWLLAAESVNCLPPVGTAVEGILHGTATEPETAYRTQYPPTNEEDRLFIPESHPVRFLDMHWVDTA